MKKYTGNNLETCFKLCQRAALCLEYSLHLAVPFGESDLEPRENAVPSIDAVLDKTYLHCFKILSKNHSYFGPQNYPNGFSQYPNNHAFPINNAPAPKNATLLSGPDPFWHSVHSQCIMSAYDTLVQLLADEYINSNTFIQYNPFSQACGGVYKIFKDTASFHLPLNKEGKDESAATNFNEKLRDRITNIYIALSKCTPEDLASLGLTVEHPTSITKDQNYHRLVIPSKTLLRFFDHKRPHCPDFKYKFRLIGPDCNFLKTNSLCKLEKEDMEDGKNKSYTWNSNSLILDCFPYAREIGTYVFELTISFGKRNSNKNVSIKFSCTVKIQDDNNISSSEQGKNTCVKYIDLTPRAENASLSPIEYLPLNIFNSQKEHIFSLHNIDFCTYFTNFTPTDIQEYIKLLCCTIPNQPNNSPSLDSLRSKDTIDDTSAHPIDQLYLHYQIEQMFCFELTEKFFKLEHELAKRDIILNDEEFHSLCQLGGSRNIFSRSFFLEFALLPLFLRKSLAGSALIPEEIRDDEYDSPVKFNSKNHFEFQRDLWHRYLKQFLALWNNLIMPACEWFFTLSLFHSYGINFHAPAEKSSVAYREKMAKIYGDLCDYIEQYSETIEKPIADDITPDSGETYTPVTLSYSKEYIINNIAKNNRIYALNLSDSKNEPIFLHSLTHFSKDTILRKQNEKQKISNANRIQQAYKELWL